jgi:hypothetical protein
MSGKSWEEGEQRKRYRCKRGCVWGDGGWGGFSPITFDPKSF